MSIVMLGICHATAPLPVRERAAFVQAPLEALLTRLIAHAALREAAVLSTCNRCELYAVVEDAASARALLEAFWCGESAVTPEELARHARFRLEDEAVAHLMRVASGLESRLVGEHQILAQLKQAHQLGLARGAIGPLLDASFRFALVAGKRMRSEPPLASLSSSLACKALGRAQLQGGPLNERRVLVLGAGPMGTLAAQEARRRHVEQLFIANRTPEKAERLAERLGAEALPWHEVSAFLPQCDLVLSCCGASAPVLRTEDVARAVEGRSQAAPLWVFDLGLPRNVEPGVASLPGARLVHMDELGTSAAALPLDALATIEARLREALAEFQRWRRGHALGPTIQAWRARQDALLEAELQRFFQRHRHWTPAQRAAIAALCRSLGNKWLHAPLSQLRRCDLPEAPAVLAQLFELPSASDEGGPQGLARTIPVASAQPRA